MLAAEATESMAPLTLGMPSPDGGKGEGAQT